MHTCVHAWTMLAELLSSFPKLYQAKHATGITETCCSNRYTTCAYIFGLFDLPVQRSTCLELHSIWAMLYQSTFLFWLGQGREGGRGQHYLTLFYLYHQISTYHTLSFNITSTTYREIIMDISYSGTNLMWCKHAKMNQICRNESEIDIECYLLLQISAFFYNYTVLWQLKIFHFFQIS